mgnify:CR=1 FL=1
MSSDLLQDLEWRGLLAQTTDRAELERDLKNGPLTFYVGFDPTAPSLHVGNLVIILAMKRFQLAGHNPIALVGGATGLVGDPSGRNEERSLNDVKVVNAWVEKIKAQLSIFLNFSGSNKAIMANNLDWTAPYSALEFLRDIGKYFSVNQMLAKDSVSARLESGGISYTEFSYQVLQALDFLELYKAHNCKLQLGGSDQWGNITAGVDLIRRVLSKPVHALTTPLMIKADGNKFGKTEDGTIWLSPDLTSPYSFYQFWLNSDDRDIEKLLKYFSLSSRKDIEEVLDKNNENLSLRIAQKYLAKELTTLVHGKDICDQVINASDALFGQGELKNIDESVLKAALSETGLVEIENKQDLPNIIEILVLTKLCDSKSSAKRTVDEGGAYINNVRINDPQWVVQKNDFLHAKYLVVRKGKKSMAGIKLGG